MDPKTFFKKAVDQASGCMNAVKGEHLDNTTPCTEWNLRTLINHVVNELMWVPEILNGKTIEEVGNKLDGDLLGDNFLAAWENARKDALNAVESAELSSEVHLSYGDFPASHYISEVAADIVIHGWDVAQSIMCTAIIDPEVAQAAYDHLAPHIQGYRDAGMVAEPITIDENVDIQNKLLAMAGRKGK